MTISQFRKLKHKAMRSITPEQRVKLYTRARQLIITKDKRFICTALTSILKNKYGCRMKLEDVDIYFPELLNHLPITRSRSAVLLDCIKEAKNAHF